jgi:hypothetical protein
MSRETWVPLLVIVVVAVVGGTTWSWLSGARESARLSERETRRREREAHAVDEMRSESARLLGDVLPGVELGTDVDAVRVSRPAIARSDAHGDPGFDLYDEQMPNGAQVVYAFEARSGRLERVQLLSQLDGIEGIAPHLAAMHERYGAPTGVWDCTDEGGLRTRRFTWRGSHLGLADVVLLYGTSVSLTLYATTNEQMQRSLQRAGCVPTPPDAIDRFPTAAPEQIQEAQRQQETAEER